MGSYENLAIGFVDPTDVGSKSAKQMAEHFYQAAYPTNAAFWQQAFIDKRFKVGDQVLWSQIYGENEYFNNRKFFFNYILRIHNMIEGYQRRSRKSTVAMPLHQEDMLADDYTTVLKWCENRDGFGEYFSQAFGGAIDTGLNLLHLYLDYTNDPISGDLFTDVVDYNNMLLDPFWRKMDFSDLGFAWRRRWVTKTQAKALLPERDAEIDKLNPSALKDGRFPLQAELLNLDTSRLFPYDEIHYRDTREAKMIVDPYSGEAVEWEEDDDSQKDELKQILAMQPWLKVKKMQVPTVRLVIMLQGRVVYNGPNLLGIDSYPFAPMVCYREPDMQSYAWRQFGVVRNLRSSQYLFNLRKVIEMDILQSQVNSGWIYPVDVVTDPKAFRQKGQGFLIPLKGGHLPNEIQRIDPPAIPQSMIEISKMLQNDIMQISGVNEELLGSAEDDKAGILAMARQGAGLTTLNPILDKADFTQRIYGKIRLDAIRKNFSKGKIKMILGKDPDPRFFSTVAQKYSIAVEEGNYSSTQRINEMRQLLHLREIGVPIPNKSLINAAIITNKQELLQTMEQEAQQQNQMQQAQAQKQDEKDKADIMAKFAKARRDIAGEQDLNAAANQKMAQIQEIQAKSEHEKVKADLETVRMMIALEDMDLANLRASLELAEYVKLQNSATNAQGAML